MAYEEDDDDLPAELEDDDLLEDLDDFPSEDDPLHELEERRGQERRPVEEAGGGESEGFELAEQELIEHTSHGDEHAPSRIMRDAAFDELSGEEEDDLYGEGDRERKGDS
jgi:hypothetical protein